ncbi:MAG: hypothetical protein KGY75_00860 [Candidatus Cloacimonetes bacterium]|nr:hypothetical protein [Candidatus Cloacimonadota bacterium]MBS3766666.1 hypothetical protein [Candidatus Cloacimonadota bacterium]
MKNKYKGWLYIAVFVLVVVWSQSVNAETTQVTNFEDLMENLNRGEEVKVVVHYGDCKLISDNEVQDRSPQAIGGMKIHVFEYFAKGAVGNTQAFVAFSHSSLINYRGFLYNYVKFKVTKDNQVTVTAQYVEPQDYEIEMNEKFFSEINDGKNEGAVYFYRVD